MLRTSYTKYTVSVTDPDLEAGGGGGGGGWVGKGLARSRNNFGKEVSRFVLKIREEVETRAPGPSNRSIVIFFT